MTEKVQLAKASSEYIKTALSDSGGFYLPSQSWDSLSQKYGLTPEKLTVPKNYHKVLTMCYDFYQRGGLVTTVINRLSEFTITEIRNGQRKTTDEANAYYSAVLHRSPSRLMRYLRSIALEYYLSGLIIPNVTWEEKTGAEISPSLIAGKKYVVPVFDYYPPILVHIEWAGWGKKKYYLKVSDEDKRIIRNAKTVKEEQKRRLELLEQYPQYFNDVANGADMVEIKEVNAILRKEISYSPYPTPYLFNVLEALIFKQQLRRMDFSVASRIINAILLVQEGSDMFPLTEETRENLDELKTQILARANNPLQLERLFMLFSNHTTKLTWVTPDVAALLDQDKYRQTNEEIYDALGFPKILITGESSNSSGGDISTWAIQPQMEDLRSNLKEWITDIYEEAGDLNRFRNIPEPNFKPVRLVDFVKNAAMFQQGFTEGNISRTTRSESLGTDFETEVELMKDERKLMEGLPEFPAMPYSAVAPLVGGRSGMPGIQGPNNGRPLGSQNVPVNNRNSGVKPKGQQPVSRLKSAAENEMDLSDEEVINLIDKVAKDRGIIVNMEMFAKVGELLDGEGETI
jgi:hypothetical protein